MNHDRRIRFAVQLVAAENGRSWADVARRSEEAGFSVISLPDHLGDQFAPIPALAAAAAATERVGLSMFVLANDLRHPGVLAKEVATLDVLSGGRVELGLGAGWNRDEYRSLGIEFDPPSVRIDRLEESVSIIKELLAGETVTRTGGFYRVDALAVRPRTVRPEGVPIVLGGGGRRMLSLAARLGDIVSIATSNAGQGGAAGLGAQLRTAAVRDQVGWVKEAAGDRFASLELNLRVRAVAVGIDRLEAARQSGAEMGCDADDLLDSPFCLFGSVDEVAEQLTSVREELAISYFTVSQRHMDQMAPVVAQLRER
jgi:probable F420-dependent oxidoreductase